MEEVITVLRISTPFLLASLGELIIERSGVLNLGIEGVMTLGALTAFLIMYSTGNSILSFLFSTIIGGLIGYVLYLLLVRLGTSQHVTGLGFTLFLVSFSYFLYRIIFISPTTQPLVERVKSMYLVVFTFILYATFGYIFHRTNIGLVMRAVGDNAKSVDRMGYDPIMIRKIALIVGNILISLGGSYLSIAQYNSFLFNIVGGRGWISLALVSMGNWEPLRILIFGLIFGFIDMLQIRIQIWFPQLLFFYPLFLMLPYLVTILLLCIATRTAKVPKEILKVYRRE